MKTGTRKRQYQENSDEDDLNIYSSDVREGLLEDDALSPMEEAFMNGYESAV